MKSQIHDGLSKNHCHVLWVGMVEDKFAWDILCGICWCSWVKIVWSPIRAQHDLSQLSYEGNLACLPGFISVSCIRILSGVCKYGFMVAPTQRKRHPVVDIHMTLVVS